MSISFRFSNLYTTSIGETYSAEFFFICHVIHVGMAVQGKDIKGRMVIQGGRVFQIVLRGGGGLEILLDFFTG